MSTTGLKDYHQSFIDDTKELSQQVKDKLLEQLVSSFDLDEVLENPAIGHDLITEFLDQFKNYYQEAIKLGLTFGDIKAKLFTDANS